MPLNLHTNYEILGTGEPVLFLHGWGSDISDFKAVTNIVSQFYKTINIDFWGFGKSDNPKTSLSVEDYADLVYDFINKQKLGTVNIVGHSFGGRVAIKLCTKYPKSCKSLILSDSAGLRKKLTLKQKYLIKRYKKLKIKVNEGLKDKKVLEKFGSDDYKQLNDIMKQTFVKVVNEDLSDDARKISIPTLLVWGKKDKDTPLYMGKTFNKLIKNSKLIILNGGHYCHIENLQEYSKICMQFWEEQ